MISCPRCRKSLPVYKPGKVHCVCGNSFACNEPTAILLAPCIHRGSIVGAAECDCQTKPDVYQCNLRDEFCVDRKPVTGPMLMVTQSKRSVVNPLDCLKCPSALQVLPLNAPDDPLSVAIITTHYNPCGFNRMRETFYEWRPSLGPMADRLICIEMVIGDSVSEIEGSTVIRANNSHLMWQKEAMINVAIRSLPNAVRYVAWLDHDAVFTDPDWLRKSIDQIDSGVDALQPFSKLALRNQLGKTVSEIDGACAIAKLGGSPSTGPGLAWVASRPFLKKIGGLYQHAIVGGGDSVFFSAITKNRVNFIDRQPPAAAAHMRQWVNKIDKVNFSFLPGLGFHLWHGDRSNRQYVSRDEILRRHNFDPEIHVEISRSGLLRWTEAAGPDLRSEILAYFKNRDEDGQQASV